MSKIIESYERMFPTKPKKARPPLEAGDHPEQDQSDFCNEEEVKQYQTLIGQLQWLISLRRFDIAVHTMSLSRYRAQPQKGHLDRAKRIFEYLAYLPEGAIRFSPGSQTSQTFKIKNLTGQELSMGAQKRSSLLTSLNQEKSM